MREFVAKTLFVTGFSLALISFKVMGASLAQIANGVRRLTEHQDEIMAILSEQSRPTLPEEGEKEFPPDWGEE